MPDIDAHRRAAGELSEQLLKETSPNSFEGAMGSLRVSEASFDAWCDVADQTRATLMNALSLCQAPIVDIVARAKEKDEFQRFLSMRQAKFGTQVLHYEAPLHRGALLFGACRGLAEAVREWLQDVLPPASEKPDEEEPRIVSFERKVASGLRIHKPWVPTKRTSRPADTLRIFKEDEAE